MDKKLYRSRTDRIIGGVAGGLGKYFDIDPVILRILFVFITFVSGGAFILFYLIAWVIIPEEGTIINGSASHKAKESKVGSDYKVNGTAADEPETKSHKSHVEPKQDGRISGGLILIVIGAIFLIQNFTRINVWATYWPIILIAIGIGLLVRQNDRKE